MVHSIITISLLPTAEATHAIAALSTPTITGALLLRLILRQLRLVWILERLVSRTRKGKPAALHEGNGSYSSQRATLWPPTSVNTRAMRDVSRSPEAEQKSGADVVV